MDYEAIKDFWDRNASGRSVYSGGNFLDEPAARFRHECEVRTFSRLVQVQDRSLLELGCGSGRWGLALAPQLERYHGVDMSPAQVEIARAALPANATVSCSDVRAFETNDRFDIVYLSGLIQYLAEEDALALLRSVGGWLKPGGLVVSRDSVCEKGPTRHHQQDGYECIYRQRTEHIALLQGVLAAGPEPLLLTRELDSYGTPAGYPVELLKKVMRGRLPRMIGKAWYPVANHLSWFIQTRGQRLYAWDLRHKFFVMGSGIDT